MKHLPFKSNYRTDYDVVEERRGNVRLYPHTEQLPVIHRAIQLEFNGGLPPRIARVDKRGSEFDKIVLRHCAGMYCHWLHQARPDELCLYALNDRDMVSRPAIVQKITEDTRQGRLHRFRFYRGPHFFQEIYVCGKRIAFADHVLERFITRTEQPAGAEIYRFLLNFFESIKISLPVGPGRCFISAFRGSLLAIPYKETPTEYIATSCLTINEINCLGGEIPPYAINIHYDLPYIRPRLRTWIPTQAFIDAYRIWERKVLPREEGGDKEKPYPWGEMAYDIRDLMKERGHGPGSKNVFVDSIPGPMVLEFKPGATVHEFDELALYKKNHPDIDWDAEIESREKERTYPPPRFPV